MKSFIVFAAVIAAALAAPVTPEEEVTKPLLLEQQRYLTYGPDGQAVILRYESENTGIGGYNWGFASSNGIEQEAQGTFENVGTEDEAAVVIGRYSYPGPDGVTYTVTYRAGKFGFEAQGDHLPVA